MTWRPGHRKAKAPRVRKGESEVEERQKEGKRKEREKERKQVFTLSERKTRDVVV